MTIARIICRCGKEIAQIQTDPSFKKYKEKSFKKRGYLIQYTESEDIEGVEVAKEPCDTIHCPWKKTYCCEERFGSI